MVLVDTLSRNTIPLKLYVNLKTLFYSGASVGKSTELMKQHHVICSVSTKRQIGISTSTDFCEKERILRLRLWKDYPKFYTTRHQDKGQGQLPRHQSGKVKGQRQEPGNGKRDGKYQDICKDQGQGPGNGQATRT
jgi:hypothetical protein